MRLDLSRLNAKIDQAFQATVTGYTSQCRTEISTEKWVWDGTTHRRSGEVAGSPRDIIDTGELFQSQQEPTFSGNTARIDWTAGHAAAVHEGSLNRGKIIPGRPWTRTALEVFPVAEVFAEELRREL